jgi:hypothetical protein
VGEIVGDADGARETDGAGEALEVQSTTAVPRSAWYAHTLLDPRATMIESAPMTFSGCAAIALAVNERVVRPLRVSSVAPEPILLGTGAPTPEAA